MVVNLGKILITVKTYAKTIETKGAKRWEVVVTEIIKYTVVLIIGAVLFKFGLKP